MTAHDVRVVDDTDDCRPILRGMLEAAGHRVRTAASGPAALVAVGDRRPQVILLDVMMPGMSGIEVLERLRAAADTAAIPVILVTARTGDDDVLDGYQHGADYYITRPYQTVHGPPGCARHRAGDRRGRGERRPRRLSRRFSHLRMLPRVQFHS